MLTIGTNGIKNFKVIARENVSNANVILKSETTGESFTDSVTITESKYYNDFDCDFGTTLDESSFYTITIKKTDDTIIYKDKVFCTDQTLSEFSVNDNTYIEHSSNNEFIIIWAIYIY